MQALDTSGEFLMTANHSAQLFNDDHQLLIVMEVKDREFKRYTITFPCSLKVHARNGHFDMAQDVCRGQGIDPLVTTDTPRAMPDLELALIEHLGIGSQAKMIRELHNPLKVKHFKGFDGLVVINGSSVLYKRDQFKNTLHYAIKGAIQ